MRVAQRRRVKTLPRIDKAPDCVGSKTRCNHVSRRDAIVRTGSWVVFLGVLGGASAVSEGCGAPSVTDLGASAATPTPSGSGTPNPTPTGSATPTPVATATPDAVCGCNTTPTGSNWSALNIAETAVPMNAVAYNSGNQLYLCHDSQGFYVMDSVCTHAYKNMGSSGMTANDLSSGFQCPYHGATFDANGGPLNGVGPTPLTHYALTTDSNGKFFVDLNKTVAASCRC